jgi:hypothetical protein
MIIHLADDHTMRINNVYLCTETSDNILSQRRLREAGWYVDFNNQPIAIHKGHGLKIHLNYIGKRPCFNFKHVRQGIFEPYTTVSGAITTTSTPKKGMLVKTNQGVQDHANDPARHQFNERPAAEDALIASHDITTEADLTLSDQCGNATDNEALGDEGYAASLAAQVVYDDNYNDSWADPTTTAAGKRLEIKTKPLAILANTAPMSQRRYREVVGTVLWIAMGSLISWASQCQGSVITSTPAAEYVAASDAVAEIRWLRTILEELNLSEKEPTPLHIDNEAALAIGSKPTSLPASKHIDVKYHIVCEAHEDKQIRLQRVTTHDQLADVLTKALNGPTHRRGGEGFNIKYRKPHL